MADSAQSDDRSKRKKSRCYVGPHKRRATTKELCPGVHGVLVTCNFEERRCLSEAYNLLNEYADRLYGPEKTQDAAADDHSGDEDDEDDVEAALSKEVAALKAKKPDHQRFQSLQSGAKNVIFVRCSKEVDSTRLVHVMLDDINTTKKAKARFSQRFLPISDVSYTSVNSITEQAKRVLAPHFHEPACRAEVKFAVVFKSRNNGDMKRDDIIKVVADVANAGGITHKVDLSNPELVICVEIIKNNCCMSVVKDFYKLKRYNIHSIVNEGRAAENKPAQPQESDKAAAAGVSETDVSAETTETEDKPS